MTVLALRHTQQLVGPAGNGQPFLGRTSWARSPEDHLQTYCLYIRDPHNGRVVQRHEFVAQGDETALWISEGFRHSRPMDLWCGRSKIHVWERIVSVSPKMGRVDTSMPSAAVPIH